MKKNSLTTQDLVTIGVFATLAKCGSLMISLAGGGMNPLTMVLSNLFTVVLLSSLVVKISKPWTLTLAHSTGLLVSALVLGRHVTTLPFILVACVITEGLLWITSAGYRRTLPLILGVFFCEFALKVIYFSLTYLRVREQPTASMILTSVAILLSIGLLGSFIGIFVSHRFVKELRRASLIFN